MTGWRVSVVATIAALFVSIGLAWLLSCRVAMLRNFALDDAFINFQYARNLAEGHGIRFNARDAEPTEGASSLLQVLLSAAVWRAGIDQLTAARAVALVAFLSIPIALALVVADACGVPFGIAWLVAVVFQSALALLPETGGHLASGMETVLYTAVHAWALAWVGWVANPQRRAGAFAGVVGAVVLSVLTIARPEGLVAAVAYLMIVSVARCFGTDEPVQRPQGRALPIAATLFGLFAAGYLLWKLRYFGSVLPNPYYVKSRNAIFGTSGSLTPGLKQVARFVVMRYAPLAVVTASAAFLLGATRQAIRATLLLLLPSIVLIALYARAIHEASGGFRYEYPYLPPLIAVLVACTASAWRRAPRRFMLIVTPLTVGAVCTALLFMQLQPLLFEWVKSPWSAATGWVGYRREGDALGRLGRDLGDTGLGDRATILLTGAGQVPYHSGFFAIDWIGLNTNYLSGRTTRTLDEVWRYIDEFKPDVVYSFLPPAANGVTDRERDPGFQSPSVQTSLRGRGSELFRQWNRERVAEMFYREMRYVRDHYEFGAAYTLRGNWALIAYVRRDSPHGEIIHRVLRASKRADWQTDLATFYVTDPRGLGASRPAEGKNGR